MGEGGERGEAGRGMERGMDGAGRDGGEGGRSTANFRSEQLLAIFLRKLVFSKFRRECQILMLGFSIRDLK